jgi:hypothetical protein
MFASEQSIQAAQETIAVEFPDLSFSSMPAL